MKPIGPLMHEHRLIERMITVIARRKDIMAKDRKVDTGFIDTAVDFIRTYADRTHHGKEEDILFRDLSKMKMTVDHARIMQELLDEHVFARKMTAELVAAKESWIAGNAQSIDTVIDRITTLVEFYPGHIRKEDKEFFFPILNYFTKEEQDAMLAEFYEFDRRMIHDKYRLVIEAFEE
ncbi:MAG: hemerythrin domain-containing protein [Deltaproteobacteria bacterium]|nr:hemerythrin domain-containing protein [Candidatus Zymogenaceae bacterium]